MITEKLKLLIEKLLEKTLANQVIWNRSSGNYGFQLILTKGSVSIDNYFDEERRQLVLSFSLYNDNGENIERVTCGEKEDKEEYNFLANFYLSVKRKFLKVDETIDFFFKEVDNEGTIGIVKKEEEPPF